MIDLRRNNTEAGTKQWMGCIYAGQRRVDVSPQRIVEDEGRACRHVTGCQEALSCRHVTDKR